MNSHRGKALVATAIIWLAQVFPTFAQGSVSFTNSFINFETAPVHPVAISPDGKTLAVCNLPDSRVELFDLTAPLPRRIGSVFVGVDPVTARFRTDSELWVVNHISDSISIIDVSRFIVVRTLDCF